MKLLSFLMPIAAMQSLPSNIGEKHTSDERSRKRALEARYARGEITKDQFRFFCHRQGLPPVE